MLYMKMDVRANAWDLSKSLHGRPAYADYIHVYYVHGARDAYGPSRALYRCISARLPPRNTASHVRVIYTRMHLLSKYHDAPHGDIRCRI